MDQELIPVESVNKGFKMVASNTFLSLGVSLMNIRYISGPRTNPCGISQQGLQDHMQISFEGLGCEFCRIQGNMCI